MRARADLQRRHAIAERDRVLKGDACTERLNRRLIERQASQLFQIERVKSQRGYLLDVLQQRRSGRRLRVDIQPELVRQLDGRHGYSRVYGGSKLGTPAWRPAIQRRT